MRGRHGNQRDGKTTGQGVHSGLSVVHPILPARLYLETENILQLISDLEEACKSPETPYFLGSLILVREGDTSFSVIDGQQRLVSLSIIIAALRDLEHDEEWMRLLDALIVEPETSCAASPLSPD